MDKILELKKLSHLPYEQKLSKFHLICAGLEEKTSGHCTTYIDEKFVYQCSKFPMLWKAHQACSTNKHYGEAVVIDTNIIVSKRYKPITNIKKILTKEEYAVYIILSCGFNDFIYDDYDIKLQLMLLSVAYEAAVSLQLVELATVLLDMMYFVSGKGCSIDFKLENLLFDPTNNSVIFWDVLYNENGILVEDCKYLQEILQFKD